MVNGSIFHVGCMSCISLPACHAYFGTGVPPVWRAGYNHLNLHLQFQWMEGECVCLGSSLEQFCYRYSLGEQFGKGVRTLKQSVACIRRKSSACCRLEICQIGPYHRPAEFSWQLLIQPMTIFVTVQNGLKFKSIYHQRKMV